MRELIKFAGMSAGLVAMQVVLWPILGQWVVYNAAYSAIAVGAVSLAIMFLWMHMTARAPFTLGLFFTFLGIAWIQGFWIADRQLSEGLDHRVLSDTNWFWLLYVGTSLSFTGIYRHCHDFYTRSKSGLRWVFFGIPLLALFVAMLFLATPSHAQGCRLVPTDAMQRYLSQRFDEAPIGRGTAGEGQSLVMIELWENPETGTWTMVATKADGTSCPIAAGENWRGVEYRQIGEAG